MGDNKKKPSKYSDIVEAIFLDSYKPGMNRVPFVRDKISEYAKQMGIGVPKNVGDVVYKFRYRAPLPDAIQKTAPEGREWVIVGKGTANYEFQLTNVANILPNPNLELIPIPDNTPEIISLYQLSDEQSMLCKIRYNRMIDTFLGMVTYSMQNHLRTQVKGIGQIELDELYVGVNKKGQHFIIPVEAKVGKDMVGMVQLKQDIDFCKQNFPDLICIPIAVHKMEENALCLFRLRLDEDNKKDDVAVRIVDEKHYKLMLSSEIDISEIALRNQDQTE